MDITIYPGKLSGTVRAVSSKSQAHRLLICAAFSDCTTVLECPDTNQDIEATAACLRSLGAGIAYENGCYTVCPAVTLPDTAILDCRESGSTLRFMLPVVCALGVRATISMSGRLPHRPLSPLWEELERMGATLSRPTETTISVSGQLRAGEYTIAGNVSSQFISGLLLATALIPGRSHITVTGQLQSKPYIDITRQVLDAFGVSSENHTIAGGRPFHSPGNICVEGDWSNAAFFLAANRLGSAIEVTNLNRNSPQGDRRITDILQQDAVYPVISAANIPDLVPIMAVYFGAKNGAEFTDISRLRMKESDRVASVSQMLEAFGSKVTSTEHTMSVTPCSFRGCTVHAAGDHRIAMAAAIGATVADGPVTILGAECVSKSYPAFWQEFKRLGGNYEQYIR